jgi:hypothetical protein
MGYVQLESKRDKILRKAKEGMIKERESSKTNNLSNVKPSFIRNHKDIVRKPTRKVTFGNIEF